MKRLVIFDLDGTLLNSLSDLAATTNHVLAQSGFPIHEEKAYRNFLGKGLYKLLEEALPPSARNAEHIACLKELFVAYYQKHSADHTKPYEGILPLLEHLQQCKIQLAVLSNKYQAATTELVRHYFPTIHFAAVCGQQDGFPTKPDPLFVRKIMQQTACLPADTLYVGDSMVDMQTAANAGVQACAVLWGFSNRTQLQPYRPAYWAHEPLDILQFI